MTEPVDPSERSSPGWMERPVDDRIVEALAEEPLSTSALVRRIDADAYTIRTRLQVLGMHHFLDLGEGDRLELTTRGRQFLRGDHAAGPKH